LTGTQERRGARPQSWQRNLYALTVASFLMFTAFGFVFPFLPLFISELGVGDLQQVEVWSGVSSFGQAMVLSAFSPIWGAVADRRGRRLMVLRAAFGGGVVIGLMGLSQNIWQFMALRFGTNDVARAETAATTPVIADCAVCDRELRAPAARGKSARWPVNWRLRRRSGRLPPQLRRQRRVVPAGGRGSSPPRWASARCSSLLPRFCWRSASICRLA